MKISEIEKKTIELLNPWWQGNFVDIGIERKKYILKIQEIIKNRSQILFILGSRRVGKTKIIFQYIDKLIKEKINPKKILFLSLDNSNLENLDWYSYIIESDFKYIFLDEVYYSQKWAQRLKSLYDLPGKNFKIICSGSSSKLIEDNKAFLTGRTTNLIIYPLDLEEFLTFTKSNNLINDYLYYGGYPEYVLEKEPNYLNELIRDVIEKDIIKIHKIKNSQYLFDICQILAKQIGFKGSSNKVAKILGLDNKTAENYIQYLKEVRLINLIHQYSPSVSKRIYSPKKFYFNDLGMRNSFVGFSDIGSLVENAVFLNLEKNHGIENIFYLNDLRGNEVDFLITLKNNKIILVESKYINLENSIINSLPKLFFKEVYGKKIIKRFVITDGINKSLEKNKVKIEFIALENFLNNDYLKEVF